MARKRRNGYAPWSLAGGPDPEFDDRARDAHHAALTAADLLDSYRRRFPRDLARDYDMIVRRLGYVWDCPQDGAASVVGYRCPACGRTRAAALAQSASENVAYVRRLCLVYADRGVDAMLDLAPHDVEWIPRLAEGRVLRGSEELRAFLTARSSQCVPRPAQISPVGEHVLVRFQLPDRDPRPLWSMYLFEDGRLIRAVSADREEAALTAAA
jgi:hypothetical protein